MRQQTTGSCRGCCRGCCHCRGRVVVIAAALTSRRRSVRYLPPHQAPIAAARFTSRNKQETDSSRHSTAPPGAQNSLCGLDFRKVRQILLRLRQKISSIIDEAKERKLWVFEEGQSISSLESRQAWARPEPPTKRLILLSPSGDFNGSAQLRVCRVFRVRELAGRSGSSSETPPLNPPRRSKR